MVLITPYLRNTTSVTVHHLFTIINHEIAMGLACGYEWDFKRSESDGWYTKRSTRDTRESLWGGMVGIRRIKTQEDAQKTHHESWSPPRYPIFVPKQNAPRQVRLSIRGNQSLRNAQEGIYARVLVPVLLLYFMSKVWESVYLYTIGDLTRPMSRAAGARNIAQEADMR